jgi:hypothetical protein
MLVTDYEPSKSWAIVKFSSKFFLEITVLQLTVTHLGSQAVIMKEENAG